MELSIDHFVQADGLYIRPSTTVVVLALEPRPRRIRQIYCVRCGSEPIVNPPPFLLDVCSLHKKHLPTGFLASHFQIGSFTFTTAMTQRTPDHGASS